MKNKTILRFVPILAVKDLTRSIAYYRLLGFSARRYRDGDSYAFLTRDGHELHLTQSNMLVEGQHPGNGSTSISPRGPQPRSKPSFVWRVRPFSPRSRRASGE